MTKASRRSPLSLLLLGALATGATDPALEAAVSFRAPEYYDLWDPSRRPTGIVSADFDGDGVLDLATADYEADAVTILRGQGAGKLSLWEARVVCNNPRALDAADLNGDGLVDLAVACRLQKAVVVLAGNGDLSFQPPQELEVGYVPNDVLIEDVDGDGNLDLVSADQGSDAVSVLYGRGGGFFDPAQSFAVGSNPLAVAAGDLDGDGAVDLATANLMSSSVSVLRGDGHGGFLPAQHVWVGGVQAHSVAVGDFDGDGFDDVACAVFMSEVTVMLSNGDGTLRPPARFATGTRVYDLVAADLNDDGRLDLIGGGIHEFVTLEGAGDGSFPFFQEHGGRQGSSGVSVTVADLDADGRPDLVAADRSLADVGIFLNATLAPAPGSTRIAAEDFEGGLPEEVDGWRFESSGPTGRIEVVDGRLRMDANASGTFVRNEADWTVDLSSFRGVRLSFVHYEIEQPHPLPERFADHADGDGVAISVDRKTWHTLVHGPHLDAGSTGRDFTFDLDRAAARIRADHDPGFELGVATWIRFQQYGRTFDPYGGREWDDIELTGVPGGVANLPPRPVIGLTPQAPVAEGTSVRLSVQSVGDPNPGDTHTFEWRFGDGGTAGGRGPIDHAYLDDGLFTVDLWVTDQDGLEGHDQGVVSVTNVPPLVDAGSDLSADSESPVSFDGRFSDPGVLDSHAVVWEFGDGQDGTGTLTPSHVYSLPGSYTASLTVDDGDGGVGRDTLLVTVAPVYRLQVDTLDGGPFRGPEGGPFTPPCLTYQVRNLHDQPRGWSVSFDRDWLVATPAEGTLGAGATQVVQACLASGAAALGPGEHEALATFLEPNGLVHDRNVALSVARPGQSIPHHQTFDDGLPGEAEGFSYYTSDPLRGRTTSVDGRMRMDVSASGGYALNEAELMLDLAGAADVELRFFQANHRDEQHPLPLRFEGHYPGDGVSMSADGTTWYRLLGEGDLEVTSSGRGYTVALDAERDRVRATYDPGFRYGATFRIRFQQYDNYSHPTDGRDWDDIHVTGLKTDLRITPDEKVVAQGPEGGPLDRDCQPYTLTNVGGGQLAWSASVDRGWLGLGRENGSLASQESTSVDVCWDALALPLGPHEGQVTFVDSGAGWVQHRDVAVVILSAGRLPYAQDFSSGLPGGDGRWEYHTSDPLHGRIEVRNEALRMDTSLNGSYSLNEAVLTLDLVAAAGVQLRFLHREHNDEIHPLSPTFTDHSNGDGVAISADGVTWYTVLTGKAVDVGNPGRTLSVDLDAEVARIRTEHDSSFGYSSAFKIKFQQYDNFTYPTDGREWDDILVTAGP